jgi:hypothetical protein
MERVIDLTQRFELRQKALAGISKAVARDVVLYGDADTALLARGASRHVKAGDALDTGDFGATPAPTSAALAAMINAVDLLGQFTGATRLPLMSPARLQTGAIAAETTAEAAASPILVLTFNAATAPVAVRGTIVVTNDALRAIDAVTQNAILDILVNACVAASNRRLLAILTAGSPTSPATPAGLFAALDQAARPFLICGLGDLLDLDAGAVRDLQAAGITILTAPEASGTMIALDATGLVIGDSGAEVRTARSATIDLDLDGGSPRTTTPVNLFQADMSALTGLRYIRVASRPGSVAWATV